MQLPKLNFKEDFVFDIKKDKDTFFIYDLVRKSWLVLTPEEWVRQHFVHYFIKVKKYAPSALILEKKLEVNGTLKRIERFPLNIPLTIFNIVVFPYPLGPMIIVARFPRFNGIV